MLIASHDDVDQIDRRSRNELGWAYSSISRGKDRCCCCRCAIDMAKMEIDTRANFFLGSIKINIRHMVAEPQHVVGRKMLDEKQVLRLQKILQAD